MTNSGILYIVTFEYVIVSGISQLPLAIMITLSIMSPKKSSGISAIYLEPLCSKSHLQVDHDTPNQMILRIQVTYVISELYLR